MPSDREPPHGASHATRHPVRPRDLRHRRVRRVHGARRRRADLGLPAARAARRGGDVTTAEGLGGDHPVLRAFADAHAFQCGFCTPGLVLTVANLLEEMPAADGRGDRTRTGGQSVSLRLLRQDRRRRPARRRHGLVSSADVAPTRPRRATPSVLRSCTGSSPCRNSSTSSTSGARVIGVYVLDGPEPALVDCGPPCCAEALEAGLHAHRAPADRRPPRDPDPHPPRPRGRRRDARPAHTPACRSTSARSGAPHLVDPTRLERERPTALRRRIRPALRADRAGARANIHVLGEPDPRARSLPDARSRWHHVSFLDSEGACYTGDVAGCLIPPGRFLYPASAPPGIDLEGVGALARRDRGAPPVVLRLPHFGEVADRLGHLERTRERLREWAERVRDGADGRGVRRRRPRPSCRRRQTRRRSCTDSCPASSSPTLAFERYMDTSRAKRPEEENLMAVRRLREVDREGGRGRRTWRRPSATSPALPGRARHAPLPAAPGSREPERVLLLRAVPDAKRPTRRTPSRSTSSNGDSATRSRGSSRASARSTRPGTSSDV